MFFLAPPVANAPPLAYPHPIITEVLYAVPTKAGDANRDGTRDSAGDEFVELVNPHDRPINLRGYSITDSGEGKARFKFTFPDVTLQPGQVAVVFNGSDAHMKGDVGTSKVPPEGGNPDFHDALVFDAKSSSSRASFANKSDYALLVAPNGSPLECVFWGDDKKPPANCPLCEEAPAVTHGSVQRARIDTPAPKPSPKPAPETTPKPASTSPASPSTSRPKEPDPKSGDAAAGKPASSKDPSSRKTYTRKSEAPPEPPPPARKTLTFGPFEAHPRLPASLVGELPGADDDSGILFSPGLYPLVPADPASRESGQTTEGKTGGGAQAPSTSDRPNAGPPR